jgi:hypothetical protein
MNTDTLISDVKARFAHNSAKAYLKEKYEAKLIVADQGGLWKADQQTISTLNSFSGLKNLILIDTFGNPLRVEREELLKKLKEVYLTVTFEWYQEWQELESKR